MFGVYLKMTKTTYLKINVPIWDETDGVDWNIACNGTMTIDRETSTAIIT